MGIELASEGGLFEADGNLYSFDRISPKTLKPRPEAFDFGILGALAGALAAVTLYTADLTITRELLMGFVVAGYAGADFIGGLIRKWLPS